MSSAPADPAKARLLIIQTVRLSGLALTLLGVLIAAGKIDLPALAGWIITAAGLGAAIFVPAALIRKWKSPQP